MKYFNYKPTSNYNIANRNRVMLTSGHTQVLDADSR